MKQPVDNTLLQGIVGSKAYGLAGADSDTDQLGIYRAPLDSVLGLHGPEVVQESLVHTKPDLTLHEVGKYLSLALRCNPTVLELLWLPSYVIETPEATAIILLRQSFLSERYVRSAYGGYAKQQADRLLGRHKEGKEGFSSDIKKRTAKHARHCARLLFQGEQLLRTGEMTVDVSKHRATLFEFGEIAKDNPQRFYEIFEMLYEQFRSTETKLPDEPDREKINDLLVKIRKQEI